MCGICGLYQKNLSRQEIRIKIEKMNKALKHRGPDGDGIYVDENIGIGHTRLSIRELSDLGSQPMLNNDKTIIISFNGEIYNFEKLRDELKYTGSEFRGRSDTEVILKVYEKWGLMGLKKLEGMFSIAIWDKKKERLVLIRDRLGIKPLFYRVNNNGLVFGSEIKSIKASSFFDNELDNQALSEYAWYGNSFESKTIYKNIKNLPPGNWLIFEKNNLIIEKYWELEEWFNLPKFDGSKSDCIEQLNYNLNKSVKRHYSADVPVSLFLSGGVDSSAIAIASNLLDNENKAYTAVFENNNSKSDYSNSINVANALNLNHSLITISENNLEDAISKLVLTHDEPFGDAANIPLYLMSKEFSKLGKVVIQGDGGDELFSGYNSHSITYYSNLLANIPIINYKFKNSYFKDKLSRLNRILKISREKDNALRMAYLMTMEMPQKSPMNIFTKDRQVFLNQNTDPFLAFKNLNERIKHKEFNEKIVFSELLLQLPSQFLPKVDRSSMANGIESRVPLLDDQFVKFALSIPYKWNINSFQRKIMLRKCLKNKLPKSISKAPKSGFGVPYEKWISSKLNQTIKDSILDSNFINMFGLDKKVLEDLLIQNNSNDLKNGFLIWKIFQLSQWYFLIYNVN